MSKSSKARNRPRRVVGARLLGPPRAKRSLTAGLSVFPLRKLLVPLFMVAALVLWAPAEPIAAGRSEPISVAYCIDCVPFQFQGEDGKPAGLIIDLWRLWSEKTGIEIDFRPGRWDETLRMVRDEYLLTNTFGTAFVDTYYQVSPAIADVVANSPALAALVRVLLVPVVFLGKVALMAPALATFVAMSLGAIFMLRRRGRRRA